MDLIQLNQEIIGYINNIDNKTWIYFGAGYGVLYVASAAIQVKYGARAAHNTYEVIKETYKAVREGFKKYKNKRSQKQNKLEKLSLGEENIKEK